MIPGRATSEGTASYVERHPELPGNFRPILAGIDVSSLGIGTYLGEQDDATDQLYREAIEVALEGGLNLADSAVNYRWQRSERAVGAVMRAMIDANRLRREEVVVATKGGYITFDGAPPPDPRGWFEERFIRTGIIAPGELVDGSHCIAPRYLEAMLELSRQNLGVETVDIYYLHNPEAQLGAVAQRDFIARIRAAFEFLERMVAEGTIAVYGTATWSGYRVSADDKSHLELEELAKTAIEVGGRDHHFRVIQLPYNLGMPEALTLANQQVAGRPATILQAAAELDIAVCASASLLQGRLSRGLPAVVAKAFEGLATDAQRAAQFVRSTPGVDMALVGMKSAGHVREMLEMAKVAPAPPEAFSRLFEPNPRP